MARPTIPNPNRKRWKRSRRDHVARGERDRVYFLEAPDDTVPFDVCIFRLEEVHPPLETHVHAFPWENGSMQLPVYATYQDGAYVPGSLRYSA